MPKLKQYDEGQINNLLEQIYRKARRSPRPVYFREINGTRYFYTSSGKLCGIMSAALHEKILKLVKFRSKLKQQPARPVKAGQPMRCPQCRKPNDWPQYLSAVPERFVGCIHHFTCEHCEVSSPVDAWTVVRKGGRP